MKARSADWSVLILCFPNVMVIEGRHSDIGRKRIPIFAMRIYMTGMIKIEELCRLKIDVTL